MTCGSASAMKSATPTHRAYTEKTSGDTCNGPHGSDRLAAADGLVAGGVAALLCLMACRRRRTGADPGADRRLQVAAAGTAAGAPAGNIGRRRRVAVAAPPVDRAAAAHACSRRTRIPVDVNRRCRVESVSSSSRDCAPATRCCSTSTETVGRLALGDCRRTPPVAAQLPQARCRSTGVSSSSSAGCAPESLPPGSRRTVAACRASQPFRSPA